MSGTLSATRKRVRTILRDLDRAAYAFATPDVDSEINDAVTDMASRLRLGETWTTGLVTLVSGTDLYTLSGSAEYGSVVRLRLASTGNEIPILSAQEFEAYRQGQTVAVPASGTPVAAMLYESPTQTTRLRVWPTPNAADTLDAFFTVMPLGTSLTADASTIPFDTLGLSALAHEVAGRLSAKVTAEVLAQIGLSANAASVFFGKARDDVHASLVRRARQAGNGRVRRGRAW